LSWSFSGNPKFGVGVVQADIVLVLIQFYVQVLGNPRVVFTAYWSAHTSSFYFVSEATFNFPLSLNFSLKHSKPNNLVPLDTTRDSISWRGFSDTDAHLVLHKITLRAHAANCMEASIRIDIISLETDMLSTVQIPELPVSR
jgi:hypothetical protein